jgi:uncharacterized membrane protein YdjX (TVP38/TMEM64 family)
MGAMSELATALALYFAFMVAAMSILSLPLAPATLLAAKVAPPWAVAVVAASAAAIAAVFDHYFIRRAFGLKLLSRVRSAPMFSKAERWAKVAPFFTTAAFAGFPIPFTIVRVLMPLSGYPVTRYVMAVALGRFPRIFVIAALGRAIDIPTEVLVALLVLGVVVVSVAAIARKLGWTPRWSRREQGQGE